jgi:hypothetical protein
MFFTVKIIRWNISVNVFQIEKYSLEAVKTPPEKEKNHFYWGRAERSQPIGGDPGKIGL